MTVIKQYPLSVIVPATGGQPITTRILEAGQGDDVVICVHGVGSRADRFRPTLEPLAEAGYRVYALDLPGHGFATKGPLPLSVPYYAEFVTAVVRQLPAGRVTVLGTSLGGHIGGHMTRLEPTPDRLAMIGTLGIVPMPEADRFSISRVILRNRTVDDCEGKLKALLWDDYRVTRAWAEEESLINNSAGAEETFAALGDYFEQRINEDLVIEEVRAHLDVVQTGLMWGDRDVIVSVETGRECMQAIPELPMAWIRDTGHAPYWERPEAFVAAMEMLFDPIRREAPEFTV
jgi:2-hydroxy-6-oxonona-2,4-dienedioate hydrolase